MIWSRISIICQYWYLRARYRQHSRNIAMTSVVNIDTIYNINNLSILVFVGLISTTSCRYCYYQYCLTWRYWDLWARYSQHSSNIAMISVANSNSCKNVDNLPISAEYWLCGLDTKRQWCVDVVSILDMLAKDCQYRAYQ